MGTKKYKLTDDTIIIGNHKLHRIQALIDFSDVKCGDIGGYIESEKNLSQYGNCWVGDNAKVHGNAQVYDDAKVFGNVLVYDYAQVYGYAQVFDNAEVYSFAEVYGNAGVYGYAQVYGDAMVCDDAVVHGCSLVFENALVYGFAKVGGNAKVFGNSEVRDYAKVNGYAEIYCNAVITDISDYIVFKNSWSSGRHFTWTKSNNMWKVGCFYGTGEELIKKAYQDSQNSGKNYERYVKLVEEIKKEH